MGKQKLTANSDELNVAELFAGDYVFSIPYFQRAYKWRQEKVGELLKDVMLIVDEEIDSHFLGALIYYTRKVGAGQPLVRELIDGQQRVTSLYLLVCAVIKIAAQNGDYDQAGALFLSYIVINKKSKLPSNLRLFSSRENRAQVNRVVKDLLESPGLAKEVAPFKLNALPSTYVNDDGQVWKNYLYLCGKIEDLVEANGEAILEKIYDALFDNLSIVAIDVYDALNGPKIFDSLNSKQHPMTIGDLVRNEVFSKVAGAHPDQIERLEQTTWQPFYQKFQSEGNLFDAYFFPFGLIVNPSAKKSQIFNELRKKWAEIDDPSEVVEELTEYQDAFLDLASGSNRQNHTKPIHKLFRNIYLSGAPSSTLPFLMQLSNAIKSGAVTAKIGAEILELVEAFLVRRSICGIEPTGLHAVFKKLWQDCNGKPTRKSVAVGIKKHSTVAWPDDDQVVESICNRSLDKSNIAGYLISAYNDHLGGDIPVNRHQIEHVLPENPCDEWFDDFTVEQHQQMKGLLGNLIPLSQPMNGQLGNRPYAEKRKAYKTDSIFKSAREFADKNLVWTPAKLIKRTQSLANWAISRWSV